MTELLAVLGLATLPAAGSFTGGMIAQRFRVSNAALSLSLHAAAGVMLAVVAVKIMPEALRRAPAWVLGVFFGLGGLAHVGMEQFIRRLREIRTRGSGSTGLWMVYTAIFMDLVSDGIMIGAGSSVSLDLAFVLAVGTVFDNMPAGFAIVADLKDKGIPEKRRTLLAASFAAPALTFSGLCFVLLSGRADALKTAVLVFTAGLLTVAAVEDMLSEAHRSAMDTRWSAIAFVAGFTMFTLVSALLEATAE